MLNPHVNVPYDRLSLHAELLKKHRLNIEVFFSSGVLDDIGTGRVEDVRSLLGYSPEITIHGPFMDLSPGAVDRKVRDITRQRFRQVFDIAEVLKPRAVVFHSGYEKWKYGHKTDIWLDGCLDFWPEFIQKADELGTVIAVENIFEDSPENLELLMGRLGSESFGICFDAGHFNLFSKVPLSAWIKSIGPWTRELHLHDNDKGYDSHLAIGDGSVEFGPLLAAFRGRDVIYTVEAYTSEDVLKSIERLRELSQTLPD